jgi:hypothetical protein
MGNALEFLTLAIIALAFTGRTGRMIAHWYLAIFAVVLLAAACAEFGHKKALGSLFLAILYGVGSWIARPKPA